jgi:hypothetical protein
VRVCHGGAQERNRDVLDKDGDAPVNGNVCADVVKVEPSVTEKLGEEVEEKRCSPKTKMSRCSSSRTT